MCFVHVFDCADCGSYSRISLLNRKTDVAAVVLTDVVCSVSGCVKRPEVLRDRSRFCVVDCLNTQCDSDNCQTISVSKSCVSLWEYEPENKLPVRIDQQISGMSGVNNNTSNWFCRKGGGRKNLPQEKQKQEFLLFFSLLPVPSTDYDVVEIFSSGCSL